MSQSLNRRGNRVVSSATENSELKGNHREHGGHRDHREKKNSEVNCSVSSVSSVISVILTSFLVDERAASPRALSSGFSPCASRAPMGAPGLSSSTPRPPPPSTVRAPPT